MLVMVMLGVVAYLLNDPSRQVVQQLQDAATSIAQRGDSLGAAAQENLPSLVALADRHSGFRVIILDASGRAIADSRSEEAAPVPPLTPLPRFKQARPVREWTDVDKQRWICTLRLLDGGSVLVVAAPQASAPAARRFFQEDFLPPLILTAFLALVLALFLAFMMSRWVASPLQRMSQAAKRMAAGEYEPISLDGPAEVKDLAQAFNEMGEQVRISQQAQRDFVANVSHELKTPLTSIQGFAQAILDGTADTRCALQQAAGVIYDEAARMNRMVIDLLDLARMDSGIADFKRAPLELNRLLQGVVEKFIPQARQAQVALRSDIQPLPGFIGDEDRLVQVLTNLLDNALKHTPAGGEVVLRARPIADFVEISVADSGPGIPPEDLARIFERFYQIDKSRRGGSAHGAGLGLAIAREIVQAHHGAISVQSVLDRGSQFVVKLPVAAPDDTTVARRRSPAGREARRPGG
jgi:signal transduction histidine kinase